MGLLTKSISVPVLVVILFTAAHAWDNGGLSADPLHPSYGTHDWIAHHALDWLPSGEKQYILDNLNLYLYATELPDNCQVGTCDSSTHHVYYFANGSLQDDASARQAQVFYQQAIAALQAGNFTSAAKAAGIMTHYLDDLGVFAHVMGLGTDWGQEQHHQDYESYVEERTNNYTDDFNVYLSFDGSLDIISAYEATLRLARDTTFDLSGSGLTAVWMDSNYNWDNPTFSNRAGASLNLAVNMVTDVLHTIASWRSVTIDPKGGDVIVDGSDVLKPSTFLWLASSNHTLKAESGFSPSSGTRLIFAGWSDGDISNPRSFSVAAKADLSALWITQYFLAVSSPYGSPQGEGWYERGSIATISVASPLNQGNQTRRIFTGWKGDISSPDSIATVMIDRPLNVMATWKTQYLLTVDANGGLVAGEGWYDRGSPATARVTSPFVIQEGKSRLYFVGWVGAHTSSGPSITITMNEPVTLVSSWKTQFYLTVNSEKDYPRGEGWYDEGTTATFSVTSPLGVIIQDVFQNWNGDSTANTSEASIIMNSSKTVTARWGTDFSQLLVILGAIAVGGGGVAVIRKKSKSSQTN